MGTTIQGAQILLFWSVKCVQFIKIYYIFYKELKEVQRFSRQRNGNCLKSGIAN